MPTFEVTGRDVEKHARKVFDLPRRKGDELQQAAVAVAPPGALLIRACGAGGNCLRVPASYAWNENK